MPRPARAVPNVDTHLAQQQVYQGDLGGRNIKCDASKGYSHLPPYPYAFALELIHGPAFICIQHNALNAAIQQG